MKDEILRVENLKKYFYKGTAIFKKKTVIKAVDDVSFSISGSKTLGLVGESGCGKTTLGRTILRLIEPTSGKIFFRGENILEYDSDKMRRLRKNIQIIFQDPFSSLNPRMRVIDIVSEPLLIHKIIKKEEAKKKAKELLSIVNLREEHLYRYPHEFSGGQRQRIIIARAIASNPEFLILDEPTSALDVSVQAKILNLLLRLQKKYKLTYLFISHDLSVIKYICDNIAVMYLGKIVEIAENETLFENPLHPYTRVLISAIPSINFKKRKIRNVIIKGEISSGEALPSGCRFHPRCPEAMDICKKKVPAMIEAEKGHFVSCFLYGGE